MLTTKEAAAVLGVERVTVNQYIQRGQLQAVKHGRDLFITEAELERFKQERPKLGWPKGKKRKETTMNATLQAAIENRDWDLIAGLWHATDSFHGLPTIPQEMRQDLIDAARADGVDILALKATGKA